MENSFYYTFSTIAQSLAALMAILGAFAMFRLQTIDSDLRARSYSLMRSFGGHEMLNELLVHECYGDFLKEFDAHVASIEIKFGASEKASISRLRGLVPLRKTIVYSLALSFFTTVLAMICSVYLLTTIHRLAPLAQFQWILIAGVGVFSMCLVLQLNLVWRLLRQG